MIGQPILVDIHAVHGVRPHFTEYIGRASNRAKIKVDSKWANIFPIEKYGERSLVLYEKYVRERPRLMDSLDELTNQVLSCWCITTSSCVPPLKCHGQVLIKLWIEKHQSPCITRKCKFYTNEFCTYNPLGCYIEDEGLG